MKKIGCFVCFLMVMTMLLCGCAGTADSATPPTGAPNPSQPGTQNVPMYTTTPPLMSDIKEGAEDLMGMGLTTPENVKKASGEMEKAVEQLSEVDEAFVIPHKDRALVGLRFNQQYQGEVDERLQKMVLTRLQSVEKGIHQVAVTDDTKQVNDIEALAEKLDSAASLEDITPGMEEIMQDITVYRE